MNLNRLLLILTLFILTNRLSAQTNTDSFVQILDSLSKTTPALTERVDFTVNELPLHEFIRGIANEAGLNVNLDPGLNQMVSNNFSNVQVKDLLLFIQSNYPVEISIIGNILNIRRVIIPNPPPPPSIIIEYSADNQVVSIEVNGASIEQVAREITRQTGKNVVVTPGTNGINVRSYIREMPFDNALEKMAVGNNFKVQKTEDGFYLFEPSVKINNTQVSNQRGNNFNQSKGNNEPGFLVVHPYTIDSIDVKAENADLKELLVKVFEPLTVPYQVIGEVSDRVTIDVKGVSLLKLMEDVFAGLNTSARQMNETWWVGPRETMEMKDVRLVQMRYRTIDSLVHIIPENLKEGVDIIEYPDLNSLVLAGTNDRLDYLCGFLKQVDKIVPVILIEVVIIDNKDSRALSTGISAGIAEEPVTSGGTVLPSVDMTIGAGDINKIIDGINGHGWVNLGKVNPNFYMTLQALEENGVIEVRSTPQLSTMNGHKATMSIGRTEYYKEELNVMYGTVTSSSQKTTTYKPVEAELKIDIRPLVAGNQEVTLKISVEQSDFTERIEKNAPPGKVSRKFESLIRVRDQEMILLGGLEEANKRNTTSGVPLLARIPFVKWLFSSRVKSKSESKLNIFIKPTIIS
ncbi:type II and III secretion system protein [Carboxylicivirga sediminis]|uniref:Type II and III secretion system protein n=1 Tax=Carboxylicivirga sediminis TaxID=2006564 RepID=A0A941F151_9BACT|nr:type II and III secretion system protein [Carboxylicivirga sediminis]MBR8534948.1 type II and III secretion system protein [Carboxylicivirga sediminis]